MVNVKGICYLCNHEFTEKGIEKHILNCESGIKDSEERMILKVSSIDNKNYFLYLAIKKNQTLRQLDVFLRKLWLECCGHLSCFKIGNVNYESVIEDYDFDNYVNGFNLEMKTMFFTIEKELEIHCHMEYDYDYGSMTSLEMYRYEDKRVSKDIKEPIYIVARNIAPVFDGIEDPFNSPRTGECSYNGPLDGIDLDLTYEEIDKRTRDNQEFFNRNKVLSDYEDLSNKNEFSEFDNDSFNMFDYSSFNARSIYPMNSKISLKEGLMTLTKDELTVIRKAIKVKGVSQLNKPKLIERLEEVIPNWYIEQLKYCDTNQIKFLKRIANSCRVDSSEIEDEYFLDMNNISFILDFMIFIGFDTKNDEETLLISGPIAVMPEEIRRIVKEFDESGNNFKLKQHQQWIKLTAGLCHVYGVIDKSVCLSFVEKALNKKINAHTYNNVIQHSLNYYIEVEEEGFNYIYFRAFNTDEIIAEQEMRASLNYKNFSKTELISYCDEYYFLKTHEVIKFMDYLRTWYDMDEEAADEIVSSITNDFMSGKLPQDVLVEIPEYLDIPDDDVLNDITLYLMQIYELTPQWFLKGHAPNEVHNSMKSDMDILKISKQGIKHTKTQSVTEIEDDELTNEVISFTTGKKINQSDPCPCGSGKKYKHCCGK